jgi:ribonuclease E
MPKQIIIAEQHRIAAVFSEDQIQELVVATGSHQVGDIYLGVVENVLPGIDAAFVNIGDAERNGFIHVSDLGPLRLKRSAGAITELLSPQQKVLVQVMKEPTGNKGPRLTGNITLPGRYLVLMPFGRGVNLSRRIRNETERNRLRALAILIKPSGMGLLVRTEAESVTEEAILEDLEFLQKQWEAIVREAASTRPPALLNRDDDFIQRVLRDMYSTEVNRIVVDSPTGVKRVKQHLMNWNGGKSPQGVLIDQHQERSNILEFFRVNAAIREALKPRVDLPSGGYIIIEPTEALTVIDVNSGSFTRSSTARETVLWTNCEAATEIARQLRLRNIAGVIIVDFIDMDSRRDQLQVLEHFNKALKADKARPQIAQLSELGLVELTRKRQGQNIYELFGRPCPTCGGLGHLVHLPGQGDTAAVETTATPLPETSVRPTTSPPESRPTPTPTPSASPETRPTETPVRETADLDYGNDLQELDLMNHPSYQELGVGSNRRRRRRRVDLGEEESTRNNRSVGTPSLRNNNGDWSDSDNEGGFNSGKDDRPEKTERSRSSKRDFDRGGEDTPEVVCIEMTPDEQEVYALMGISPLVLFNGEVKNPKNVAISVVEPGEAPPKPEGSYSPPKLANSEPEDDDAAAVAIASEEPPEDEHDRSDESEESDSNDGNDGNDDSESKSSPVIRRRRRRPSVES